MNNTTTSYLARSQAEQGMRTGRSGNRGNGAKLLIAIAGAVSVLVALNFSAGYSRFTGHPRSNSAELGTSALNLAAAAYGRLPLAFEANRGQSSAEVRYLAHGPGYVMFLTSQEAVLNLRAASSAEGSAVSRLGHSRTGSDNSAVLSIGAKETKGQSNVLRLSLVGAKKNVSPNAEERQPGYSNYFIGDRPENWTTSVPLYGQVRYPDVYPGIDLVFHGNQQQLEYDFSVAPGADTSAIRLSFQGAQHAYVDESGNLVLNVGDHYVLQHKPEVFQDIDGRRTAVEGEYRLNTSSGGDASIQVAFALGDYDRKRALVIDPVLVYSTYITGNGFNSVVALSVDPSGNLYAGGLTSSVNFPVVGGLPPGQGGQPDSKTMNIFIAKLTPDGDDLVYSTYLSGNGEDRLSGLKVNDQQMVYIDGTTTSTNFPIVGGLPQDQAGTPDGGSNAFVSKLNGGGNALVYSTYLGAGNGSDYTNALDIDAEGNAYVAGFTTAPYLFPIVGGLSPEQGGLPSGDSAMFIAKLDSMGSALVYSTYLSGSAVDEATALSVDDLGQAYLGGTTTSPDLPRIGGLPASQGGEPGLLNDAYFAKLNAEGSSLIYASYLSGSGSEIVGVSVVDVVGNLYVAGRTSSNDFPVLGGLPPEEGGQPIDTCCVDIFVSKINAEGNSLIYSTYLGGNGVDGPAGLVVDDLGSVYLAGETDSTNFPQISGLPANQGGSAPAEGDPEERVVCAFASKLEPSGASLIFSTYLCGNSLAQSMARAGTGEVYIAGNVGRPTTYPFPIVGGLPPDLGGAPIGSTEGFIAKLTESAPLLTFKRARFDVQQSDGTVEVTVVRSGGTGSALSVDFGTSDGTAIAGIDYIASSGTLTWSAGDGMPKAINIAILPNPAGDQRVFNLQLSNAIGAAVGTPDVAAVTIHRDTAFTPPTVGKSFLPSTVAVDDVSVLTITLTNTNDVVATLSADLVDNLPVPLTVAGVANAATTCPSGTVTADPGTGDVTLDSGAQIPPMGSCSVTVSVTADAEGTYTNTIPVDALQTNLGSNSAAAIATLDVTQGMPPDRIFANGFDDASRRNGIRK